MPSPILFGAIEAGGTKFVCEVADQDGRILASTRIPTTDPTETLASVMEFLTAVAAPDSRYAGIGIAAFGPLDLRKTSPTYGCIRATPKPQWSHVDLVSPLAQRFACPVRIDTDVNAAALAEAEQGAGRGCSTVVYITVGTGIGGGVCIEGRTLHGVLHPEMGHVRVRQHPLDTHFAGCCPFHGACLEGLASGAAIMARYGQSLDQLPSTHEAYSVLGDYLGQFATTVILLLAPDKLVFGGGVMESVELYGRIRATAASLLNGYAGFGSTAEALESLIVAPGLGQRSGIAGALALARQLV